MISTNFDMLQARQNEPIARQGQRKRRRRKHYHAPAKQDTAQRPPLDANPTGTATRTRSLPTSQRNDTSSFRSYDSRTGPTKTAHHKSSKLKRSDASPLGEPQRNHTNGCGRLQTVANGCERLRTVAQHPANKVSPPDPQDETRTLCYAFGKNLSRKGGCFPLYPATSSNAKEWAIC